jgi:hypothetical protein
MTRPLLARRRLFSLSLPLAAIVFACVPSAWAGDFSWTLDKVSPAINYADRDVVVVYEPPGQGAARGSRAGYAVPSGMDRTAEPRIKRVYAKLSYQGDALVHTSVCWNGTQRCVPLQGGSLTTSAFNGLDPSKPVYLVHKAVGKGRLSTPLYVKGTVIVWFSRDVR